MTDLPADLPTEPTSDLPLAAPADSATGPADAASAPAAEPGQESPLKRLITTRAEMKACLQLLLDRAQKEIRAAASDLSVFELSGIDAVSSLRRLLKSSRLARVHLLVDDMRWLDTRAPRLRALQRDYPHALLMRRADFHDRVGEDMFVLGDRRDGLRLQSTLGTLGEMWSHHGPNLQALLSGFDRRWERATHDQAAKPLGL
jgi:hypothetical protein